MYEIEKGIPIPGAKDDGNSLISAFRRMEIGDSIVITSSQRGNVAGYTKRVGIKAATRKIEDGKVRVWRIA